MILLVPSPFFKCFDIFQCSHVLDYYLITCGCMLDSAIHASMLSTVYLLSRGDGEGRREGEKGVD